MKNNYAFALPLKDICCTDDCCECPYFLRFDICGYEVATYYMPEGGYFHE